MYIDNILIFSLSVVDHVNHIRDVLDRLLEIKLFVKAEKCDFHMKNVEFLQVHGGAFLISQIFTGDLFHTSPR